MLASFWKNRSDLAKFKKDVLLRYLLSKHVLWRNFPYRACVIVIRENSPRRPWEILKNQWKWWKSTTNIVIYIWTVPAHKLCNKTFLQLHRKRNREVASGQEKTRCCSHVVTSRLQPYVQCNAAWKPRDLKVANWAAYGRVREHCASHGGHSILMRKRHLFRNNGPNPRASSNFTRTLSWHWRETREG
jgi:hypothetical protein